MNLENIPYIYQRHPVNTDPASFLREPEKGGNCELLTHAITYARGFELPRVRSSELFTDTDYTKVVPDISDVQTGDILGLSRENKVGFRGVHMGILWVTSPKTIFLVHNAINIGHVAQQTLPDAMKHNEHERVRWIKRPTRNNPALSNPKALERLGLPYLAI